MSTSDNKFAGIQQLGRALMLPIAVLPVAGLLLRLGQPDLLNIKMMAQAGDAIFGNLALIFAIGVAVGFAKDNNGTSGLAGAIGYLVITAVLKVIDEKINMGVLSGILSGLVAGALYNRYKDIKLPSYLAFFGGKRFVPIVTGFSMLLLGAVLGYVWMPVQTGIDSVGRWLIGAGEIGVFAYGVLNRVLIVTGLHHILNTIVWFQVGDFASAAGKVVHGDLTRFFAGDKTAGMFMSGFFPVMMFGLPAACLAMYRTAKPENKQAVGGLLFSMALTAMLTGVTEPVEFAFMFLAPALYAIHAVLTGLAMALMHALNIKLGFGFSAGLFDYLLNFGLSTKPLLLIPVGIGYFALYYVLFVFFIKKFDLKTPGREDAMVAVAAVAAGSDRARLHRRAGRRRQPEVRGRLHHPSASASGQQRQGERSRAEGAGFARPDQAGRRQRASGAGTGGGPDRRRNPRRAGQPGRRGGRPNGRAGAGPGRGGRHRPRTLAGGAGRRGQCAQGGSRGRQPAAGGSGQRGAGGSGRPATTGGQRRHRLLRHLIAYSIE